MAKKRKVEPEKQFEFYMDLLGHDILNSNQAVLSYLELIISSPGVDKRVKMLAEKAIPHVRTSTVLVENVKRLVASRSLDPDRLRPVDIVSALRRMEQKVRKHFPSKKISLVLAPEPRTAMVLGEDLAEDLVLNVLITAVRLNPGDDLRLDASITPGEFNGKPAWFVKIEDRGARLPPFLNGDGIEATYDQDISVAVRSTGILFAKMMAKSLGGDFDAHALTTLPEPAGAKYTVTLRRADGP
ncbi:MAG: hypothetical protein QXJ32_04015 [Thermoplasmata archaeon]